jgi:hypothetical protein
MLGVVLAGFFGVMVGMVEMTLGDVGVMPGLLVIAPFMVLGRGQMVLLGVFMMLRRLSMVLDGFFGHGIRSLRDCPAWGSMNSGSILYVAHDGGITSA